MFTGDTRVGCDPRRNNENDERGGPFALLHEKKSLEGWLRRRNLGIRPGVDTTKTGRTWPAGAGKPSRREKRSGRKGARRNKKGIHCSSFGLRSILPCLLLFHGVTVYVCVCRLRIGISKINLSIEIFQVKSSFWHERTFFPDYFILLVALYYLVQNFAEFVTKLL